MTTAMQALHLVAGTSLELSEHAAVHAREEEVLATNGLTFEPHATAPFKFDESRLERGLGPFECRRTSLGLLGAIRPPLGNALFRGRQR